MQKLVPMTNHIQILELLWLGIWDDPFRMVVAVCVSQFLENVWVSLDVVWAYPVSRDVWMSWFSCRVIACTDRYRCTVHEQILISIEEKASCIPFVGYHSWHWLVRDFFFFVKFVEWLLFLMLLPCSHPKLHMLLFRSRDVFGSVGIWISPIRERWV